MKKLMTSMCIALLVLSCSSDDGYGPTDPPNNTPVTQHDENSDGDLSDAFNNPEGPFTLEVGANIVIADQQGDPRDVDYFTIVVPNGSSLTELNLTGFTAASGNLAFLGMVNGAAFSTDENSTTSGDLLGGIVYGASQLNTNMLPAIGSLDGAQGFSGALPAGTYSFWLNQTGPNSEAELEFVIE
ncbi:hypothetical protein [Winogradskyella aurantiaca]|uniref:hypothetical protein n=1 Tax=Winogradskyella aurantiaca TaxID=2219558 RepID=UPI000E1E0813|nr:hypothetical protein [Winogradskyella aurantiaca]